MTMNHYTLLGRSGLRVSRLALGTMTFGNDWGWGAPKTGAAPCSIAIWRRAATSSTLPTCTPTAPAKLMGEFLEAAAHATAS